MAFPGVEVKSVPAFRHPSGGPSWSPDGGDICTVATGAERSEVTMRPVVSTQQRHQPWTTWLAE